MTQKYQDRIVELRRVKADELVLDEANYRDHPDAQRAVMKAALEAYGWVDCLIAYELPDGRLKLIDGEMRQGMDEIVPVLVVNVTEDEAALILSIHDPIGTMAIVAGDAYDALAALAPAEDVALAAVQDAVSDGHLTPFVLPVPRATRPRGAGPSDEPKAPPRMAKCKTCKASVPAFTDNLLEHLKAEHAELVQAFVDGKFKEVPA